MQVPNSLSLIKKGGARGGGKSGCISIKSPIHTRICECTETAISIEFFCRTMDEPRYKYILTAADVPRESSRLLYRSIL